MFLGETFCLIAFTLLNSRLNPFRLAARQRRAAASAAAKKRASYDDSGVSLQNEPLLGADALDDSDIERRAAYADADTEVAQPEKVDWRKALLFWTPAACDILGTTCMNVGLFFVPVSIYQMLRGALVLCVDALSLLRS